MRFSKRCQYGIKAALYLARRTGEGYCQSREIAQAEGLPGKFLESILLSLRSAGLLDSKVGAGGGYRLRRPPEEIYVSKVIDTLENLEGSYEEDLHSAMTPGTIAVSLLDHRLGEAYERAVGAVTLSQLLAWVDERSARSAETVSKG